MNKIYKLQTNEVDTSIQYSSFSKLICLWLITFDIIHFLYENILIISLLLLCIKLKWNLKSRGIQDSKNVNLSFHCNHYDAFCLDV